MSYADKNLTCRDCGAEFVFTAGEQEFYAQKGFTNEPTRCPTCRQARKASGGGAGRSSGGGGGGGYGGGGGGGYDDRGPSRGYEDRGASREMFTTVCASCGGPAQVPFQPRGDKPVYCSDCFQQQRRASSGSRW